MTDAKAGQRLPAITSGPHVGAAVIVATVFCMALADAVVKAASSSMPLWQIFVVRSLIAIPLIAMAGFSGLLRDMRPVAFGWTMLRSFLLVLMYLAIYAAIPVLSLPTIAASLYTGPLFITLLSAILLGERVGGLRWLAILVGFAGVIAIIRPGTDAFTPAALIPVLAALLYAVAAVITSGKCAGENPVVMALALNYSLLLTGLTATLVLLAIDLPAASQSLYPFLLGNWIVMGLSEWGIVSLLAVLIVLIGAGLAKAYQAGPPSVVAAFDYSYLIFAALWGFVFFGDIPDTMTAFGMMLILLSGLLVLRPPGAEGQFRRERGPKLAEVARSLDRLPRCR